MIQYLEAFEFILNCFKFSDPRLGNNFLLTGSPVFVLAIVVCYSLLCKYGPVLMNARKPIELKQFLILFNFLQVNGNLVLGSSVRISILSILEFNQKIFSSNIQSGNLLYHLEIQVQLKMSSSGLQHE